MVESGRRAAQEGRRSPTLWASTETLIVRLEVFVGWADRSKPRVNTYVATSREVGVTFGCKCSLLSD